MDLICIELQLLNNILIEMELNLIKKIPGKRGSKSEEKVSLYTVVTTTSRETKAFVHIHTWEKAIEYLEKFKCDEDNDSIWRKVVKYSVNKESDTAEVEYVENHKGWGYDYIVNITVKKAYCFDEC